MVVLGLSLVGGVAYAATGFTFHGSVNVVSSGGGTGGGTGGVSYDFVVASTQAGDVALTDADLALGDQLRGSTVVKTVYLKKVGTAPTFNVAVAGANVSAGLTVTVSSPVALTTATPIVAVPVTIVIAADAPFAPLNYNLTFNLVP